MGLHTKSKFAFATTIAVAASISSAHAYIDPGTGSLILQGIIGSIAGGMFIIRTYWAKISAYLPGGQKPASAATKAADDAHAPGIDQ